MSSTNLRGKEVTLRITVNGQPLDGFAKVSRFTVEEIGDLPQQDFVGEDAAEFDHMHDGWMIRFTTAENDRAGHDYLTSLLAAFTSRQIPPIVNIKVTTKYRNGSPTTIELFPECVMRNSGGREIGGRKEYTSREWEAKTRRRIPIG